MRSHATWCGVNQCEPLQGCCISASLRAEAAKPALVLCASTGDLAGNANTTCPALPLRCGHVVQEHAEGFKQQTLS